MPTEDGRFPFGMWDAEPKPRCLGISNHALIMAAKQLVEEVATQWPGELFGEKPTS